MAIYRLILTVTVLIVTMGCSTSQNASENEAQIDIIVNSHINDEQLHQKLSTYLGNVITTLHHEGSMYSKTTAFKDVRYIFVSQHVSSYHDIAFTSLTHSLRDDYSTDFTSDVVAFIRKKLFMDAHRGSRFYDLSKYIKNSHRLAIIIVDENALAPMVASNKQLYQDAISFMLLHEMAHTLAGDPGSPIYDYLKINITANKESLDFYKEGFSDLMAMILLDKTLPHDRSTLLRHELIKYRKDTQIHHSHDTAKLLISYQPTYNTNKIEIAGTLLSHKL